MKDADPSPQTTAQGQTRAPAFVEISIDRSEGSYAGVAMGDIDGDGRAEVLTGCRDGDEGFYDHEDDPYEWHNLEHLQDHANVKADLRAMLLRMTGRSAAEQRRDVHS